MERYLNTPIAEDLENKAIFLTGPRQVGKTTLSLQLGKRMASPLYLNYDIPKERLQIERREWPPNTQFLVLDELHKMPQWKSWLKGLIDEKPYGRLLITGSARMDTFRQAGESLAGRYLHWRLHPFSVKELANRADETKTSSNAELLEKLMERGGFPEPFLAKTAARAARWRAQYSTGLVREDIMEFSRLHDVQAMRVLIEILRTRVGAPLSLASLARDLHLAQPTVKRYIDVLEALFIVFPVHPWHRNIARSLLQSPKLYFYDTGMIVGDDAKARGARFENAVATMLLKHVHYLQDSQAMPINLHYLRTKDGDEIDFALSNDLELKQMIECKVADDSLHRAFHKLAPMWPDAQCVQLVQHLSKPVFRQNVSIVQAADWLAQLAA